MKREGSRMLRTSLSLVVTELAIATSKVKVLETAELEGDRLHVIV